MVTILAFIVLGGGTALASFVISSNSQVGPETISGHRPPSGEHANLIPGSLNGTDLASNSVGSSEIDNGSVGSLEIADPALHRAPIPVTNAGCTDIPHRWATFPGRELSFYRDVGGRVHLQGEAAVCSATTNVIFTLPPGFRPNEETAAFPVARLDNLTVEEVDVGADGVVGARGNPPSGLYALDGISFRCGPSGQDGCP
jgi:hypothetical protein